MTSPFDDERLCKARSALVKINPDEFGRFNYDLICQYTRKGLNNLQSGDLIAVENYKMAEDEEGYYSILTLTQATPIHFAAQSEGAYPGHVFESMRTIKGDWESQEDQPRYATTTIMYKGIPTNWQFLFEAPSTDLPEIIKDDSVPMIGAEMRPLSREMVDAIINYGMPEAADSPMRHKRFEDIRIILDKKALLTTHFGIFGFTNTGKSNLLSSLINSFMIAPEAETNQTDDKKPNFIIIDPNDEYLGLFIDMFVSRPEDLRYIHVGIDSLADRFIRKLNNENTEFDDGDVREFFRQMKLPSELRREEGIRDFIYSGIRNASKRTRIALPDQNLSSFVRRQMREQTPAQAGPAVKAVIRDATEAWSDEIGSDPISADTITSAIDFLEEFGNPVRGAIAQIQQNDSQFATATAVLTRVRRELDRLSDSLEDIPNQALISIDTLVSELNTNQGRITIVTGRKDSDIKQFAANLGDRLYESRRTDGTGEEPCTTMVLDEADLFIPNLPTGSEDSETETIRNMCVTLARRGRKFRLGIGISTQRAAYLNTQIMGNLHTYFVSKLPRKGDRERVAEAYGIGEEELSPTFSFQPGDWLIISHDATGLTGVPIPVRADNANDRIIRAGSRMRT